jgi:hypothetical protein
MVGSMRAYSRACERHCGGVEASLLMSQHRRQFFLSPCPSRFGKSVLFAKAAPAGHRRLALRKEMEPAIRRSLWISRAPGPIGACFVNRNREHTEQRRYDRDHAHARLLELKHCALV